MTEPLYVRIRGRVQGPFELEKLQSLARRGQFSRAHQVSTDGATWRKASEFPELFAVADRLPAVPAAGGLQTQSAQTQPAQARQTQTQTASAPTWYYAKGDSQFGPTSFEELRQLASTGQLRPQDAVWCEGMSNWATADSIANLSFGAARHDASPMQTVGGGRREGGGGELDSTTVRSLARSRGWVIFLGVCSLIFGALLLIGAVFLLMAGATASVFVVMALFNFVYAAIFIVGGLMLLSYSGEIRELMHNPSEAQLAAAMHKLRAFWMFLGIILLLTMLVALVFVFLIVLGMISLAAAGAV